MAARSGHRTFNTTRMPGFRAKGRVCYGFLSGTCKHGEHCRYRHDIKYGTDREQLIFARMKTDQLLAINSRPTRGGPNDDVAMLHSFKTMLDNNSGSIPHGGPENDRKTLMACEKVYAGLSDLSVCEQWIPDGADAVHALNFLGPQQRADWRLGHLRKLPPDTNMRLGRLLVKGLSHLEEIGSAGEGSIWGPKHEPSSRICRYYKQGHCYRENTCRYSHNPYKLSGGDLVRGIALGLQNLDLAAGGQNVREATTEPTLSAINPQDSLKRLQRANATNGRLSHQEMVELGLLIWIWEYVPPSEDGPTPAAEGDMSGALRSAVLALKSLEGPREVTRSVSRFSQDMRGRLIVAMRKAQNWG
ncbi:hypothetical protein QKR09_gp6 [Fiwi virus]|uniref:C3H1-type domain-containing protein n=1 Tax=Fiwi virus TaxID=2675848 RepID=A0AAE6PQW6_9MONO|nr:hypothetical protein QKR09_gp6 [Fiwi virus]QGM12358.2 hypothetical protein [Fiwi virus]